MMLDFFPPKNEYEKYKQKTEVLSNKHGLIIVDIYILPRIIRSDTCNFKNRSLTVNLLYFSVLNYLFTFELTHLLRNDIDMTSLPFYSY